VNETSPDHTPGHAVDQMPGPLVFPFGFGAPGTGGNNEPARIEILGGKGASLAEMTRAGFPVPPGFTISTACCASVDQHAGRWPEGLEDQIRAAMGQLERVMNRTFGRGPRPLYVAVRSGAAVSMPGMMDTILNCGLNPSVAGCFPSAEIFWKEYAEHIRLFAASVAGLALVAERPDAEGTDVDRTEVGEGVGGAPATVVPPLRRRDVRSAERPDYSRSESFEQRARRYLAVYEERTGRPFPADPWEALRQSINAVFASWHSDRARAYRQHHDVRGVIGTAVNVQAMFPSERSGVLFTVDPNNPASGEMILEASWGLGEAVVSGAVTPDIYLLDAKTLDTKREEPGSRPGNEPALNTDQRREIGELGRRIETHFGVPSDIEWGLAEGRVALLQTRKIRGLEIIEDAEHCRVEEMERLKILAEGEPAVWVVHNLSETLPAPTPLTWDLVRWFMSAQGGYGQMYRLLGQRPYERSPGGGFLELIAGRIYVDPRRAAEFHFGRMPFEYDVDEILRDRTALDRPPARFNFERTDSLFFFRLPGLLLGMLRGSRRMKAMSQAPAERFQTVAVPKLEEFLNRARQVDLHGLSTADLIGELQRRRDFVLGEFAAESLVPGFFGGLAHDQLRQLLIQLLGPDEGEQTLGTLTTGLEGDVTVEQNLQLFEIANGRREYAEFLRTYGHRAVNEMELSQPRWREDHQFVDRMIERFRGSPTASPRERHALQSAVRHQAEAALPGRLAAAGGSSLCGRIQNLLRQSHQLLPYREWGKFHLMRGYETLRDVLVELGRRWDLGRDLFFLHLSELARFEEDRAAAETLIARRKLRWRSQAKLPLPDVVDSRHLEDFGLTHPVAVTGDHERLPCRQIASGAARGMARVVLDPGHVTELGRDYILVCPSTDPGWTPLFVNARGLIVERGGVLSHGAIVARDFGIPAVVLEGATRLIREGAWLELDANHGTILILPNAAAGESPLPERLTEQLPDVGTSE
jgi:phosphohistidine swiveling domain-containing protein